MIPQTGAGRIRKRALFVALAGLTVGVLLASVSDDFYHCDDVAHYLMAHDGWDDAEQMLHRWGRPGYTIPVMLVDRVFGLRGCRIFSALLTGLISWLAFLIAWEITRGRPAARRFVWLAPALVWIQPLVIILAQTTLTETPAALYLTAAVYFWIRKQRILALAFSSLLFVTRYEALVFAPVIGIAHFLALRRDRGGFAQALGARALWVGVVALVWAPLAYVGAAWFFGLSASTSPLGMFGQEYSEAYGSGTWHHFAVRWALAAGVGVLALMVAGIAHLGRRALVPAFAALGLLALHTVLFRYGLFASGGYGRFMVPAAGVVAALAAAGVGALTATGARRAAVGALVVMALAPLAVLEHDVHEAASIFALCAFGLLGAAALLALLTPLRANRAFRLATLVVALGLAGLQAALLVRPLVIIKDPPTELVIPIGAEASTARVQLTPAMLVRPLGLRSMLENSVLYRCMEAVPPGALLLTNDTLLRCYRPETVAIRDPKEAVRRWRDAPPDTVFVHGRVQGCEEDHVELLEALDSGGILLAEHRAGAFIAVAYRRVVSWPDTGPLR